MTSHRNRTYIQLQPEDGMWAGLQDRINDRFTPLFDTEKIVKHLYELFIDRATILFLKITFDIFHDTLPLSMVYNSSMK